MATLADELLNDFEESGSEAGDDRNGLEDNEDTNGTRDNGLRQSLTPGMDLDEDGENMSDAEEELEARKAAQLDLDEAADEEETKVKVEKMKLAGVNDVRSVAGLMKQLNPILEVSSLFAASPSFEYLWVYILYKQF